MKNTVIYHSADFDGLFCREIARKFLPEADLIGWNFGDPLLPIPKEGTIYVLDLCPGDCLTGKTVLPKEVKWSDLRVVWIDHHKSSIESHPTDIPGYRIDGVAACRLAWQWFTHDFGPNNPRCHPSDYDLPQKDHFIGREVKEPLSVRLAGEYDVWDKRDPDAELFQHGLRSVPLTDGIWDELLEPRLLPNLVAQFLENGRMLQYVKTNENASIIQELGFTFQWEGLTFLGCNAVRYNSHLFTAGLKPEHDACFGFKRKRGHWEVSLYHAPGQEHHDLSLIAVKHGGGGHRGACGFRTDKLPFL